MTYPRELHKAQVSILRTLRHAESARYSMLMRPTGLESDVFKFHLSKLVNQKIIEKKNSGDYVLTSSGKEFANNLSKTAQTIQKQPKLSVALVANRQTPEGTQYLFQKRLRNPFYGFWGCISGPAQWGKSLEEDIDETSGEILEDKLFAIVEASNIKGEIDNKWSGGFNAWTTLEKLENQEKYFKSSRDLVNLLESNNSYSSEKAFYSDVDY
jgi:predicted transcriptional regulator